MNPDTDWRVKMYSSAIGAYTMITNDSQVFLIQKECEILDKEVF